MDTQLLTADAPAVVPPLYRIGDNVARVRRQNATLLVAGDGRSVRISPVGEELLSMLVIGATFDELAAHLQSRYPTVTDTRRKLNTFLDQLQRVGLLGAGDAGSRARRMRAQFGLFEVDPAAAWVARAIQLIPQPLSWTVLWLAIAAAIGGIVTLAIIGPVPHPSELATHFNVIGLAVFAVLVVPLHEAAHAIACRLAGAPVGRAGVILHGWLIPGPFVDTSRAYRIAERFKRIWIPAAGPLIDLFATGAAAWYLIATPATTDGDAIAAYVFLLGAIFVYLDTNPLSPSDGSRVLEVAVGDDLARRSALSRKRARMSGWKQIAVYRTACSMHVQCAAALAYFWWF